jgi:hypothetical protein
MLYENIKGASHWSYWDGFQDLEDIENEFKIKLPEEIEILIAIYDYKNWGREAFILYEQDRYFYEVHGSYCSCYGFEGQWDPEETSEEFLFIQSETESFYSNALKELFRVGVLVLEKKEK